jgi:hypothetical protein
MAKIFLSFAGDYAREVAEKLETLLTSIYKDLIIFYSPNITIGDWRNKLMENLGNASHGIVLLTDGNYGAHWLLYEVGALALKFSKGVKKSRNNLSFILLDREKTQIEPPFDGYQNIGIREKKKMKNLFEKLGNKSELEKTFDKSWKEFIAALKKLEKKHQQTYALVNNQDHFYIDKTNLMKKGELVTVGKLPELLCSYVHEKIEGGAFKTKKDDVSVQVQNSKKPKGTEVKINKTRFSTFFCFTDKKYLLLYDREKASKNINRNVNNRYDVFGSVEFENYAPYKKIKNKNFLKCIVQDIHTIPGLACEDNELNNKTRETVVMIGFLIVIKGNDLDYAEDNQNWVTKWLICGDLPKNLTSKANLAVEALRKIKGKGW